MTACRHCGRTIIPLDGGWIDPAATGDDSVWRETCDSHDTFIADHEPEPDRYGRVWNIPDDERCPDCGQPDNCGDCTHRPLTSADVALLGGIE